MTHFVCTGGCKGVSDKPGNCQAQSCSRYGMPLIKCNCNDREHTEVIAKENKKE